MSLQLAVHQNCHTPCTKWKGFKEECDDLFGISRDTLREPATYVTLATHSPLRNPRNGGQIIPNANLYTFSS